MGWIAAGAGTLIAACLIYTIFARFSDQDVPTKDSTAVAKLKEDADARPNSDESKSFSTVENSRTSNGNLSAPAPPTIIAPDPPVAPSTPDPVEVTAPMPPPTLSNTSHSPSSTKSTHKMLPPPRPATNTPSNLRSSSPPRLAPPRMAPPPRPSAAASLRVPVTKALSNSHMQPASSTLPLPPNGTSAKSRKSRQIILAPGCSPLDWASLTHTNTPAAQLTLLGASFHALSPSGALLKIPPTLLKQHNGRKGKDAWTTYQGRVYNITAYLPYHPGGKGELLRAAGRDGEELFMEVHPWVNWTNMLSECCVGILVPEGEGTLQKTTVQGDGRDEEVSELDEMD